MKTDSEDGERLAAEADARISHFIPSVELKGPRAEQVQKPDVLIAYLEQLRGSLAGNVATRRGSDEQPSRSLDGRVWPWLAGGGVAATAVILMLSNELRHRALTALVGLTLSIALAAPAGGQTPAAAPADPNPGKMALTGSFDVVSTRDAEPGVWRRRECRHDPPLVRCRTRTPRALTA